MDRRGIWQSNPVELIRSADSCEPLLISYFCTYSSPVGWLVVLQDCSPGVQSKQRDKKHLLTIVHTAQKASKQKKVTDKYLTFILG